MALSYRKIQQKAADCFNTIAIKAIKDQNTDKPDYSKVLCAVLADKLKLTSVEITNLLYTAKQLPDALTIGDATKFLLRVIANKDYLKEMEIPKWDGSAIETDIHVLGVIRIPSRRSSKYLRLECRALTDLPAGTRFHCDLSENMIYYLFSRELGLGRNNMAEYTEIGGMYFRAVIEHFASGMQVTNITATPTMRKFNKEFQRKREDVICKEAPNCGLCKKHFLACKFSPFLPTQQKG